MTTIFHVETQTNLRRKNFIEWIKASYFLEEFFSNRDDFRSLIQIRRKRQLQHLEKELFSKANLNEPIEVTNACFKFSNQGIKNDTLKEVRITYLKDLILAFLNVNSNRNKLT